MRMKLRNKSILLRRVRKRVMKKQERKKDIEGDKVASVERAKSQAGDKVSMNLEGKEERLTEVWDMYENILERVDYFGQAFL